MVLMRHYTSGYGGECDWVYDAVATYWRKKRRRMLLLSLLLLGLWHLPSGCTQTHPYHQYHMKNHHETSIHTIIPHFHTQIRNKVLTMWREDVTQWLSEDSVTKCHRSLKPYFRLAWRFLWLRGYINHGVAPSFAQHWQPITPNSHAVVVIGAGLAGVHGVCGCCGGVFCGVVRCCRGALYVVCCFVYFTISTGLCFTISTGCCHYWCYQYLHHPPQVWLQHDNCVPLVSM